MKLLVSLYAAVFINVSIAATIEVEPGLNTLPTAVAGANEGDTLLLSTGTYTITALPFNIDKSLTIRAVNASATPTIKATGSNANIAVSGSHVVLQGLIIDFIVFRNSFGCAPQSKVQFIENVISIAQFLCPPSDSIIVGNTFLRVPLVSIGGFLAANQVNGLVVARADSWVIANTINTNSTTQSGVPNNRTGAIQSFGTNVSIIGNRISTLSENGAGLGGGTWTGIGCGACTVAGNIIAPNLITGNSQAVRIYDDGYSLVANNTYVKMGEAASDSGAAINAGGVAEVINNILVGHDNETLILNSTSRISNNLCFDNLGSCPEGNSNINGDPKFASAGNFTLAADSLARDAGADDFYLADTNRSRNDIGAYGGPWNISQYDLQRDSNSSAPYVFPLIDLSSAIQGTSLKVRALGVSKLK